VVATPITSFINDFKAWQKIRVGNEANCHADKEVPDASLGERDDTPLISKESYDTFGFFD
jgi:hypothetical protein